MRDRVESVQLMRGVAASLVVALHCVADNKAIPAFGPAQYIGAIGVDLFFVISGFVMAHSMGRASPGQFLARRAARILPNYYVFLIPEILLLLLVGESLSAEGWLNSLFLLPVASGATYHLPYLAAGWTLGFEFAFYLVVAAAAAAGGGPKTLLVVLLGLAALPDASPWALGRWFANDILLEFAFGVAAFLAWPHIGPRRAVTLGALGAAAIAYQLGAGYPPINHVGAVTEGDLAATRALVWGLPCALIFAALLRWQPGAGPLARFGLTVGDASYTIYLSHHMVLWPVLALLPGWFGVAIGFPLAVLLGCRLYVLVEQPIYVRAKGWLQRRAGGRSRSASNSATTLDGLADQRPYPIRLWNSRSREVGRARQG